MMNTSQYWPEGTELPGGYHVAKHLGRGGMGIVYLVERRIALKTHQYAVKTMIPEISDDPGKRRDFLKELRTWIDLPFHPNLVSCRFFKTLENTLSIFAEYINGDSLDKWIKKTSDFSLEKLLDMAIQAAWGLHFAHECGVIHQDIKPSNIMVARDGTVKVTDFGLSSSRLHGTLVKPKPEAMVQSPETRVISFQGMTLPYCSLEQALRHKISRKTDMWSYGLTILTLFNGGLNWILGSKASKCLDTYLEKGPMKPMPKMPEGVVEILRRCFADAPADRWQNMGEVAARLQEQYRISVGKPYPLQQPEIQPVRPSRTFKPERSPLTGSAWTDPVVGYRQALELAVRLDLFDEKDLPACDQTSQRARALRDIEIFEMTETVYRKLMHHGDHRKELLANLGETIFNRALATSTCQDSAHCLELYREAIKVLEGLDLVSARDTRNGCLINGSIILYVSGDTETAFQWMDTAIEDFRQLASIEHNEERVRRLTKSLMNKASMLTNRQEHDDALKYLDEAQHSCEELLQIANNDESWILMSKIQGNIGLAYFSAENYPRSLDAFNQAEDIAQMLLERQNTYELAATIGFNNMFKSKVLRRLRREDQAEKNLKEVIPFIHNQIENEKREDLRIILAEFRETLAEMYFVQDRYDEAMTEIHKADHMLERIVVDEGQNEQLPVYGRIALKAFLMLYASDSKQVAMDKGVNVTALWMQVIQQYQSTPEKIMAHIDLQIYQLLKDLEFYGKADAASEMRRAVHTMGKKF